MFKFAPAVFAVGDEYQICVRTEYESMMWVKVGEECFYDDVNGILRSDTRIHKLHVPMDILNKEKKYTVCERKIIERKPYFSETEDVCEKEYDFCPVPDDGIRAYHIADAHNLVDPPVTAAKAFGKADILILNGDIPDHSGEIKNFDNIYAICDKLTGGHIPVVFSRGNHDMRGVCAEKIADYTPTMNGNSFFTFRLGSLWGIVLDCGEDKSDKSKEYGNTICCSAFRKRETLFIKDVIKNAAKEFMREGVKYKAVIVHNPFSRIDKPPFDIEQDTYREWCSLLRENVKPDIMICGHVHTFNVCEPGGEWDHLGQPCTVVWASETDYKSHFAGAGFEFNNGGIHMTSTDSNGSVINETTIK